MAEEKVSVGRIALALLGIFVALVLVNTCRHSNKMSDLNEATADYAQGALPHLFGVARLPDSVTGLQCEGVDITCQRIARATCSFGLNPNDFDRLFDRAEFSERSMRRPLSQALDDYIGPDFDVVRVFQGGDEEEMFDVYIFTNSERSRVAVNVVKDMHFDCN